MSNIDNSAVLCVADKADDCKPGNYSIENSRWLGGLVRDTYKLESQQ